MISRIYKRQNKGKDSYTFYVVQDKIKRRQFVFWDRERAELSHKRMIVIEKSLCSIYTGLSDQLDFKDMEQDYQILAEQSGEPWTPDKLHEHLKMLFLMSGPDEREWFCNVTFCQLAMRRDTRDMESPVIQRYEERFDFIEGRLEQEGKIRELAYAQVARDTGFRMHDIDFLDWDDVQHLKIRHRTKTAKADSFENIREKTYESLMKLEHRSERIFNNKGRLLRMGISRMAENMFRFHDYRRCYELKIMWNEILNPPIRPASGGDNV